jgi:hypothetical protein
MAGLRLCSGGAAAWCHTNCIDPGTAVEVEYSPGTWSPARITALGESEILVRRPGAAEHGLGSRSVRLPVVPGVRFPPINRRE